MVINLFTVFDPCVGGLQLNWFSLLLVFIFIPISYYLVGGTFRKGVGGIFKGVGDSLKEIVFPFYLVLVLLGLSVFLFIMLNNVMGLFSFVFTSTAHPVFTLGVGLVYWVGFIIIGWVQTFTKCAAHLVPEGRPLLLAPLLVVIELISHLIRPFTLSIRLAANIMAGHLIIGLLSRIRLLSGASFFVSIFLQIVLFVLEIAVALIQGLVFSILMLLYAVEFY